MRENAMPFSSIDDIDDKLMLLEESVDYMDIDALPPHIYDSKRYTKLNDGEKTVFEEAMNSSVKNDKDFRRIIQSIIVPTINKQLRRENKNANEGCLLPIFSNRHLSC